MSTEDHIVISVKHEKSDRKTSAVWDYFGRKMVNGSLVKDKFVYCTICFDKKAIEKTFSESSGTGNMINHLEGEHKLNYKELVQIKKNRGNSSSQKILAGFLSLDSQESQSSQENAPLARKRDLKPAKAMIYLCCSQLLDIKIVQERETRIFLSDLGCIRPTSDISQKTIDEELQKEKNNHEKRIKTLLEFQNHVSLAVSNCTINNFEKKTIIYAGFVNENWEYKSFFLSLQGEDANSSANITEDFVTNVLEEFNLKSKSIAVVSAIENFVDSRRNITNYHCLGQIINSILHSEKLQELFGNIFTVNIIGCFRFVYFYYMKSVNKTTVDLNEYEGLFSDSVEILQIIHEYESVEVCCNDQISAIAFVPPWHVAKYIIDKYIVLKDDIQNFADMAGQIQFLPNDDELELIKILKKIYDTFMCSINSIYHSDEPCISVKLAVKRYLLKELEKIQATIRSHVSNEMKVISHIISETKKQIILTESEILATTLDVRCLNLIDLKEYYREIKSTPEKLLRHYISNDEISGILLPSKSQEKTTLETSNINFYADDDAVCEYPCPYAEEIGRYLNNADKPTSNLKWWKSNENNFKNLSHLARKSLSTVVMSFPKDYYSIHYARKMLKLTSFVSCHQQDIAFIHFNSLIVNQK